MNPSFEDDDLTVRLVQDLREGRRVEASARLLHDRFVVFVARYFRRKGVPAASIDDLSQETFLRVFRGIDAFRDGHKDSFSAWTLQIARNVFKNWLRTAQARKRDGAEVPLVNDLEGGKRGILEESLLDGEPDPLLRLTAREEREILRTAIERLSEQRRRACEMRYLRGLKYREIAEEMNISIETVKAHLHQARTILESALRPVAGGPVETGSEKGRT